MKKCMVVLVATCLGALSSFAGLSARSYVSDGLIGHWDGVYNAGYDVPHADTASVWTELSGKSESIPVPEGASFAVNGLTTVRDHGSVIVAGTADVPPGTSASVLLDAFKSAKYTVEIAYDQPEKIPVESGAYFDRCWRAFILGTDLYAVGSQYNTRLGFNPNSVGDDNDIVRYVEADTVGKHTFTCRQDGTTASVSADGTASASWTVTTAEPVRPRGLKFNRSANAETSGLPGTYHSIRFYNRPLTDDEIAVNLAVDRVRFFGADASKISLPEGWRFDTTDDVRLERRSLVAASLAKAGTVQVNEGTPGAVVEYWSEQGAELPEVTVTAAAKTGWRFHHWQGPVAETDRESATVTTCISGDLTAVFVLDGTNRLTAKSYVQNGLVSHYDGEENVAYGEPHDGTATTWADLTGRGVSIPVPLGAKFQSFGLQTVRAYGSSLSGATTLINLFKSATYTMEIAYNKTKVTPPSTKGSGKSLWRAFILGEEKYIFGSDGDEKLGFNPNTTDWLAEYQIHKAQTVATTLGDHAFSCWQNGTDWRVDADGATKEGTVGAVNPAPGTGHGFKFNRGYYEDFGLDGTYYDIRFYARPLTADEVAVNQAIDQVRFFGADPASLALPDDWRFDTTDGVKLERRYTIASSDAASGLVSVDSGEATDVCYLWGEQNGAPVRATLKATPSEGYEFVGWSGSIGDADAFSTEITVDISDNVQAKFQKIGKYRLSAKSYVMDGLVGHWDGESNAGYDLPHDPSATVWKDLAGKFINIDLQTGFSFSAKGLKTVRTIGFGGRNKAKTVTGLDTMMRNAKYTTEIAYNQPALNTKSADGYSNFRCCMLMLGDNRLKVGTDLNQRIGIQPNGGAVSEYEILYGPTFTDITGSHTFACRQDGANVTVDVDGTSTKSYSTMNPNPEHTIRHGFAFNQDYYTMCGLDGTYYDIRIYNRALTDDEVYVNRAIDQIRFFGADPADYTMPSGWRFDTTDGIRLDWERTVTSSVGGAISVNGEPVVGSEKFWCEKGGSTEVSVSAVADEGYEFVAWVGAVNPSDRTTASGTIIVSGDFTALFRKTSHESLTEGLVYDMALDLATDGAEATPGAIYNALGNSREGGRETAVAVGVPYTGADQENIPAKPCFTNELAKLEVCQTNPVKAIYFPQSARTLDSKVYVCSSGVRLSDECVDGEQTVHLRFRWESPADDNINIYPINLFSCGLDQSAGKTGFGVGLYYAMAAKDSSMLVVRTGNGDYNHGGGETQGQTLTRYKVMRDTWYDLVVTVRPHYDGTFTYSLYIDTVDNGVTRNYFEFTGTFTDASLETSSANRYMTIATPFPAGGSSDWLNSNFAFNSFRGSIANVRVWNRELTAMEAKAVLLSATGDKWTVGALDGAADEFAAADSDEAVATFDPCAMPWRRFPRALTAERPSVTISCALDAPFVKESGHVKYLTVNPVLATLPASALVKVQVNGQDVKTVNLSIAAERTVGLRKGFVHADANGKLNITLTRIGDDLVEPLELDSLSLSGGLRIGVPYESYADDEFKHVSSKLTQFTVGNTNACNMLKGLEPGNYCPRQTIVFNVPSAHVGLGGLSFSSRIKSVYAPYKPFSVYVNDFQVYRTDEGLTIGDTFSAKVPASALRVGLNELRIENEAPTPYWISLDYVDLKFDNVFDVLGALLLVR